MMLRMANVDVFILGKLEFFQIRDLLSDKGFVIQQEFHYQTGFWYHTTRVSSLDKGFSSRKGFNQKASDSLLDKGFDIRHGIYYKIRDSL